MKYIYLHKQLLIIIVFCSVLFFGDNLTAQNNWDKVIDKNEIQVFLHKEYTVNNSYKAETIINSSIDSLYNFLIDFNSYNTWVNSCSESNLLEVSPNKEYVYYTFYDMPWPLTNRDAISRVTITHHTSGNIEVKTQAVRVNDLTKNNCIRVTNYSEEFLLVPLSKNKVKMYMKGRYDPGGYIPNWVIRKFLTYGPYDTLLTIKNRVE